MELDLYKASSQADAFCRIYCKAQANLYLECRDAVLVRLKTTDDREYIVWTDPDLLSDGVLSIVKAFYETQTEFEQGIGKVAVMESIKFNQDVFCYNGSVYYLHEAKTGNHCIRRLRTYGSQTVVEQIERQTYKGKGAENIFLSNFYLLDGQKRTYALTCWGVVYKDGCNYLPVFDEDRHYVEDYPLSAFDREEVSVGEIFKNNGYYYKLLQDENGKLFLDCSKMVFVLNQTSIRKRPPEFTRARVISVNFQK